jgi:hypothetical protein
MATMAKTAKRVEEQAESKEVAEFIQLLGTDATVAHWNLDSRLTDALRAIVSGFLEDLDRRYNEAEGTVELALSDRRIKALTRDGHIEIRNQQEADTASALCNSLAVVETAVEGSWQRETEFFNKFHKTLTGRRKTLTDQLRGTIGALKNGHNFGS